jgi:hypothetical protein
MKIDYLKGLGLPSRLTLAELTDLFADHFFYEEERALLFLKSDLSQSVSIEDFKILLSRIAVAVANENYFKTALSSETIERVRWVDIVIKRLPDWDGVERIEKLAQHFVLANESQRTLFTSLFFFWFIKTAEMLLEPFDPTIVNRLVFCLQSDKQGIGKTTFGRKLVAPFDEGLTPSLFEMDSPDFSKDAMIQMCANVLVMLDDISNWHSGGLKRIKSVISSKNIKVRPPYGAKTVSKPRSASFFATTNELGFLNEPNDTRWAIFSIKDIDKSYNVMDMEQIWAEAFDFARNGSTEFTEEMKKHCISLSSKHQIITAIDELISQYFEINEEYSQSSYELYECLPYDMKKLFGSGTGALSKLGKALTRVFGKSEASYKSGGITKWRVRFKSNRLS